MRQRTKFAVALVVVALVLGVVVFGGLERFRIQAEQQSEIQTQETANVIRNQTADDLESVAGRRLNLLATSNISTSTEARRLMASLADLSEFRNIVMVDTNGTILEAQGTLNETERQAAIGANISSQTYFRQAVSSANARVSDPVYDQGLDSWIVTIAVPAIDSESGNVTRVFAGSILMGNVLSAVDTLDTSQRTAKLTVETADGAVAVRQPEYPDDEPFETTINASSTVRLYGADWTVTVVQDRSALNARLQELQVIQGGSLAVVFLMVLALGYWEYTTNLKQTERLLEGFARVREGDYAYTISLSSATEWERISEGYNELTQGLAEREAAIREREQQLEVLNRVLRHNLQNDMNVIIGHAEMLPRFSENEQVKNASETIVRMGEELVSHGQKARQLETAMGGDSDPITVDLSELAESVVDPYRRDHPDIDFQVTAPASARARVDNSFELALDNLVENAVAYNDAEDPWVGVTVETTADGVRVQIADNGPGIPAHEYEVLEEGAETALQHGSGVGLWLAHWVVDASEGRLSFSERQPRGTVVEIVVPTSTSPDGTAASTAT